MPAPCPHDSAEQCAEPVPLLCLEVGPCQFIHRKRAAAFQDVRGCCAFCAVDAATCHDAGACLVERRA